MASASGSGLSLGTLFVAIAANVDAALQDFQKFTTDLGKMIDTQKAKFEDLATVGQSFTKIGTALTAAITAPLVGVGAAAVHVSEQLNTARTGFTTMLGSAQAADTMLKDLQKFAMTTPFEFPELVDAAKRMNALGVEAKNVIPWLTSIGDAAAAMGGGKDVIDGITLALAQMTAKGKVSAQEMNQLAERGIPAWQLLADAIGVSIPAAMKLAEQGAISSATAVPAILDGMNKKFAGSMDALSKTLTGQWSNFKDQITAALIPIGQALTPALQGILEALTPILAKVGDLAKLFGDLPAPVKTFAIALAAIAAAFGPVLLIAGQFAIAIAALGPALTAIAGVLGVSVLALGGWAVAVAAAVAALVAFAVWVHSNWDQIMATITGGLAKIVGGFKTVVDAIVSLIGFLPGIGDGWKMVDGVLGKVQASLDATAQKHQATADAATASYRKATAEAVKMGDQIVATNTMIATHTDKTWAKIHDIIANSAATGLKIFNDAVAKAAKDFQANEDALAKAGVDTTKSLKDTYDQRVAMLKTTQEYYKQGKATLNDVQGATQALADAEKALNAGSQNVVKARKEAADAAAAYAKKVEAASKAEIDHEKFLRIDVLEYYEAVKATEAYGAAIVAQTKAQMDAIQALTDGALAASGISDKVDGFAENTAKLTQELLGLTNAAKLVTPPVNATYDALKQLGMTAPDVYRAAANAAGDAYDTMLNDGQSSLYQQTQARLKWLEAEKAAALAEGYIWDATDQAQIDATQKTLDGMEQQTKKHQDRTKTLWQEWGKAIDQAFGSFLNDVVEGIFNGSNNLADSAINALEKLGAKMVELAGEKYLGKLLGELAKLTGADGLLSKLGISLEGAGSVSTPSAPSVPGGTGGAAGAGSSAASSLGNTLNMVTGIASAVGSIASAVGTFIYGEQASKDADVVNLHTLETVNELQNLRKDDWDRHGEYAKWKDDILATLWNTESHAADCFASLQVSGASLQAIEQHCAATAGTLGDMLSDERNGAPAATSFMDSVLTLLNGMTGKLDTVAAGSQMTMQLYGTDPALVAGRIAMQMRLQGANA